MNAAELASATVVYRGRFDPPGLHHLQTVHALLARCARVVVMPYGPVGARAIDENVAPPLRARLVDIAFAALKKTGRVQVDLDDVEADRISTVAMIAEKYALNHGPNVRLVHVVEAGAFAEDSARVAGADVVVVAYDGDVVEAGVDADAVVRVDAVDVAGAAMRQRLYEGKDIYDVVPVDVAAAVRRHGLYRGVPRSTTRLALDPDRAPRLLLVADQRNPKAMAWRARFERWAVDVDDDADLVVVFGGDGSMLHAVQQHWRRRVPFFGVNAGHLGFLLNDAQAFIDDDAAIAALWSQMFFVHHLPMLHVEAVGEDGSATTGLTFNDAWLERATGQSAWLEVQVDGRVRMQKLVCDGVLVSTAAGSTAYARSMGAHPLLADTPAWMIVGSNVVAPMGWKNALLSPSSTVELRALNTDKRPVVGFLHGVPLGPVTSMRARLSRAASVELAFLPAHDMAEKIARIQFPD